MAPDFLTESNTIENIKKKYEKLKSSFDEYHSFVYEMLFCQYHDTSFSLGSIIGHFEIINEIKDIKPDLLSDNDGQMIVHHVNAISKEIEKLITTVRRLNDMKLLCGTLYNNNNNTQKNIIADMTEIEYVINYVLEKYSIDISKKI